MVVVVVVVLVVVVVAAVVIRSGVDGFPSYFGDRVVQGWDGQRFTFGPQRPFRGHTRVIRQCGIVWVWVVAVVCALRGGVGASTGDRGDRDPVPVVLGVVRGWRGGFAFLSIFVFGCS